MWLDILFIALGMAGLIWGADKIVEGASATALNLGVAPLTIGLTIVAFGTSAPEFFSSAVASIEDEAALAIGNAVGSNIFNVGAALGVAILIRPLDPPRALLRQEIPALLLVTAVTGLLFADLHLGLVDSLILLALLGLLAYRMINCRNEVMEAVDDEVDKEDLDIPSVSVWGAAAYIVLGLALLIAGAEILVSGASSIAAHLGVSSAIIGLTIVAMGTSLPEFASTVACLLRGQPDLAIGNIVGSNIMNLLIVLPFPGLLAVGPLESQLLYRDYMWMTGLTLALAVACFWTIRSGKLLSRFWGTCFLLMYGGWFFHMYNTL